MQKSSPNPVQRGEHAESSTQMERRPPTAAENVFLTIKTLFIAGAVLAALWAADVFVG